MRGATEAKRRAQQADEQQRIDAVGDAIPDFDLAEERVAPTGFGRQQLIHIEYSLCH